MVALLRKQEEGWRVPSVILARTRLMEIVGDAVVTEVPDQRTHRCANGHASKKGDEEDEAEKHARARHAQRRRRSCSARLVGLRLLLALLARAHRRRIVEARSPLLLARSCTFQPAPVPRRRQCQTSIRSSEMPYLCCVASLD